MSTALQSFLNDDSLVLPPIKSTAHPDGHVYVIRSPDAATGMRLQQMANLAATVAVAQEQGRTVDVDPARLQSLMMDDDQERSFMQQVMGDVLQEMQDDGVSWVTIQRLSQYAFAYFAVSPEAAERVVAGKADSPGNRAARRTAAKSDRPASAASKKAKAKKAG